MSQLNNMINDNVSSISKLSAPTNALATDSNKVDDEDDGTNNHDDDYDCDDIQPTKRIKSRGLTTCF